MIHMIQFGKKKSCANRSKSRIFPFFKRALVIHVFLSIAGTNAFLLQNMIPCNTQGNTHNCILKMERQQSKYSHTPRRSLVQMRENRRIEDKDEESQEKLSSLLSNQVQNINLLEVRLDATLASCYSLCRFLIFDITTGAKDVPGWQLSDFIMLGGAFSSCIVLACLWSLVGIAIDIFDEQRGDEYNLFKVFLNAFISGPIWLLLEVAFGWPPGGVIAGNDFVSVNIMALLGHITTGSIGLASVMCLGKVYTSGWR